MKVLVLVTLFCLSLVGAGNAQVEKRFGSIVIRNGIFGGALPWNGFLIDFDSTFAWMAGESRDSGTNVTLGVFVFSKPHHRWLQIAKVSTAGARFGKSPPEALIQAPWDFSGYGSKDFVPLPINSLGAMHYPDQVTLDEARDTFVLHLDSDWKMESQTVESARTTLLIPKQDLVEAFDYYSRPKFKAPNPQGGANGRQPSSLDTNRTSAAAASRRSP